MFPTTTYQQRRQNLMDNMSAGILLFLGNNYSPMNYGGNTYHFRQDSSFLYYFGIDRPGLVATIDLEDGRTTIYGREATLDDIIWTGPQESLRSMAEKVGVTEVKTLAQLSRYLQTTIHVNRRVHYFPPYRGENKLKISHWLNKPIGAVERDWSVELVKKVTAQREIKSDEEVQEMHTAVNWSANMHLAAMRMCRPGLKESDLYAAAYAETLKQNSHPAYSIILTVDGQTLHNHHHHNELKPGQLVLADMGAESTRSYAGDITRTFPVDGQFTTQQKEIYQIVLDAQLAALNAVKSGVTYRSVHLLASRVITEGLINIGLMKGDADEAVNAGAHALFFPHGLGHQIGLDVHDMEDFGEDFIGYDEHLQRSQQFGLAFLRLGKTLQSGMAITVEPGLYFIPQLMDQWRADGKFTDFINYEKLEPYRTFGGIRIEDDVVVQNGGYELLGNPIPKTIKEVEEATGQNKTTEG